MKKYIVKDILKYVSTQEGIIKKDLLGKGNDIDVKTVLNYLAKGGKIATVSTKKQCEYCEEIAGSYNYYTDGTWVWPEWLFHYIIKHRIKLPDAFIKHIVYNNDYNKELIQKIVNQELEIDFE